MTDPDLIVRLAGRGDGVTGDGRFVPRAAPGDRLAPGGGLIAGPHHRDPACRHYGDCGGCQLQHIDDAAYSNFIIDRIDGALRSQGLSGVTIHEPHLSPPLARRRVALRALRVGRKVHLGFSAGGSHRVIDLAECPVMHPGLFALVEPLRGFADRWIGKDQWQLKMAMVDQGVDLLIEGYEPQGLAAIEALTDFAATNGLARLSVDFGYGPEARWEPVPATVTLADVAVAYPPYGFLQATRDGEAALLDAVQSCIGDAPVVADLFSGLGTFALNVAKGRKVYAAEGEMKAIMALKAGAARAGLTLAADHRDLFRRPLSTQEANRFAAVILDPPRAGAKEQIGELARSDVPAIAYVSCNPATFARDAKALAEGGYSLTEIWPVGQFRWSTHVELAGRFVR